jgi:dTDP-4-amino-4,6-dideoxygalactose transaminase
MSEQTLSVDSARHRESGGNEPLIHFNQPYAVGTEFDYIRQAIANAHTCGNGPFSRQCCSLLEGTLGVPKVLLTTSCTHALEMAALLLDIQSGDEVVFPSFTFVSTVNAFVIRGAMPVFCDIRPDTLNMDEGMLVDLITERTKAVVPVHYAGVGCEMDPILEIAAHRDVAVVEDNAHGLFGTYKGRPLGTFGCLATQSFHETKNFNCGEGGALMINDARFVERAEIIHEKGTNRSRFFRGEVDKYTWVDIGSSYLPSDMLAAYLFAQLEIHEEIQNKRKLIWEYYDSHLRGWAEARGIRRPIVPEHCDQAYHMFYLLMPSLEERQRLITHLKARNIISVFHYPPLHLSAMGRRFGGRPGDCPVTEDVSDRLLRLPFYNDLTEIELARIVGALNEFP